MNTAFLDPARRLKARLKRLLLPSAPMNFRPRDASSLETDVAYALQVARSWRNQLERERFTLEGSRILELGPGGDFGAQLILASFGAEVTVADRFLAPWDENYHPQLYRLLRKRWDGPSAAIDAVIEAGGYPEVVLRQIPLSAEQLSGVADASFDCVLSNAVLEHVYDMRQVAQNLARITKSPGLNLHQIDFRDHMDADGSKPLEFLLLTAREQSSRFKRLHGECGNRVRLSEAAALFRTAGFSPCTVRGEFLAQDSYIEEFVPRLRASSSPYRDWPVDDLRVLGALLVLRK